MIRSSISKYIGLLRYIKLMLRYIVTSRYVEDLLGKIQHNLTDIYTGFISSMVDKHYSGVTLSGCSEVFCSSADLLLHL